MAVIDYFDTNESSAGELDHVRQRIARDELKIAKNKAYLAFLEANPLFVEYQKLRSEASF